MSTSIFQNPGRDCDLCPRLKAFRDDLRASEPDWWNAPVPSFGPLDASILVVGLAPGMKGANRTGRPFTGDYAGDFLYETLGKFGLAVGTYGRDPNDGMTLNACRVCNAVRCLPPQNKPTGPEIKQCRPFLEAELAEMPRLKAILCLGRVSHETTLRTLGLKPSQHKFTHAESHRLPNGLTLVDSYHCSRYNTNTGRLTAEMFEDAVRKTCEAAGL